MFKSKSFGIYRKLPRLGVLAVRRSVDLTPPLYSWGEIGDTATTTVEILFSEKIQASDFTAGVTIKVNTVAQVIASGTLQGDEKTVFYVIPACDINDVITWEYASTSGNIMDKNSNLLGDVTAKTVTNYIGSQLYFNSAECSAHI